MSEIGSVLQWNMGCPRAGSAKAVDPKVVQRRCGLIEAMINDHKPTFVALQEAPPECPDHLRGKLARRYEIIVGQHGLITLYSTDWSRSTKHFAAELRATMLLLRHRTLGIHIRLWNVHFWSLFRLDQKEVTDKVKRFVDDHVKHHRARSTREATEMIVGDFNMSPYDEPILARGCLWANQSMHWALTRERGVRLDPVTKKMYRPLFNPSWELLGYHEPPFGTYYYEQSADVHGPWYVFDQMLMSPVHGLSNERHATVLQKVGNEQLWSDDRIRHPDDQIGSDHYPVLVKFKLG